MKINYEKKLDSVGGIEKNKGCINNDIEIEADFSEIERIFNSYLPQSYKEFCANVGSFTFLNLICVKCIDEAQFMLPDNKVSVGDFYCITGNDKLSITNVLQNFNEQLPTGMLPICEGELGDHICISLRKEDFEYIYYFDHESSPGDDLFLISNGFNDFITGLEIYEGEKNDDDLVKKMKADYSPQLITLLKQSGYYLKKK